jgi:hypothetical protein
MELWGRVRVSATGVDFLTFRYRPGQFARQREAKTPPFEAALLLLFGVEDELLSLQRLDKFANPFGRQWIGHLCNEPAIMLDFLVEFVAFIAHGNPARTVNRSDPHWSL